MVTGVIPGGPITITYTDSKGCKATKQITVNSLPSATITTTTPTTFCQGGSVVLTANTGTNLSYVWNNNGSAISGATSSTYSANLSGSYTVTVTNSATNCSSTSATVVVTVNALPNAVITTSTPTTFCDEDSVVLTANTGTNLSYVWKKNGIIISSETNSDYTATVAGNYSVIVTNSIGCSNTSALIAVVVNPKSNPELDSGNPATLFTIYNGIPYINRCTTNSAASINLINN